MPDGVTLKDVESMLHLCAALAQNGTASDRFTLAAETVAKARHFIKAVVGEGKNSLEFELLKVRGDDPPRVLGEETE